MDISSAMLVAIMFVVLLTIGIGNILMSLASMVDRRSPVSASRIHISWIVLVLLVYFSLFWHTIDVLSVEEWTFGEFLYVILGPVLILFASQVLLPNPCVDGPKSGLVRRHRVSESYLRERKEISVARGMYIAAVALAILTLTGVQAQAQHGDTEHEFHRNHFGGFLGASTHSDNDETGFTLGLEYARQFTPRWALAVYTEFVSGDLERDIIFAGGAIFYPTRGLGLVVAPGVEFVNKDVEHDGEVKKEDETEFLLRLGAGYGFPVGQASLGPAVFADWAGNRWTLVYGIGIVTGF